MRRRPATRRWPAVVRPTEDENRELIRRSQEAGTWAHGMDMAAERGWGDEWLADYRRWKSARAARDEFLRRNAPLAIRMAARFKLGEHDTDDLVQEAVIGLDIAIGRFDLSRVDPRTGRPIRISTYASRWMYERVSKWLYDHARTIRVPRYMQYKSVPTPLTERSLDTTPGKRKRARRDAAVAIAPMASIYAVGRSTGMRLADSIPARQGCEDVRDEVAAMLELLDGLDERERVVLQRRYWLDRTLKEVGDELGITKERVRQIQLKAEHKLGKWMTRETA